MAETYSGQVVNGVIVLDDGAPPLPEGAKVRVERIDMEEAVRDLSRRLLGLAGTAKGLPPDAEEATLTLAERLKSVIGTAKGLPPDLAEQHDHYIHGTPKR